MHGVFLKFWGIIDFLMHGVVFDFLGWVIDFLPIFPYSWQ